MPKRRYNNYLTPLEELILDYLTKQAIPKSGWEIVKALQEQHENKAGRHPYQIINKASVYRVLKRFKTRKPPLMESTVSPDGTVMDLYRITIEGEEIQLQRELPQPQYVSRPWDTWKNKRGDN